MLDKNAAVQPASKIVLPPELQEALIDLLADALVEELMQTRKSAGTEGD